MHSHRPRQDARCKYRKKYTNGQHGRMLRVFVSTHEVAIPKYEYLSVESCHRVGCQKAVKQRTGGERES